ncbi:hypothetical protein Tco_0607081 [Tanacetum coccineum]
MMYEQELASLKAQAKRLFGNENVWVEMHSCVAWDKVNNQNPQNALPSEINEPYEPSPRMDSYEQSLCLGSTFGSRYDGGLWWIIQAIKYPAKATIKFDKGTITLRSGKSKISFHRIPDSPCMNEKGGKNDIDPIVPTMTVNRLVLIGRKDKASLGKGDGVQPMEDQKFQRQTSHSYYNQGRNG